MARILPSADARGRYFIPQSGAITSWRAGGTGTPAARGAATASAVSTSRRRERSSTPRMIVLSARSASTPRSRPDWAVSIEIWSTRAAGQLGQERVARRPLVDDRGVAEAEVHGRGAGDAVERGGERRQAVGAGGVRAGLQVRARRATTSAPAACSSRRAPPGRRRAAARRRRRARGEGLVPGRSAPGRGHTRPAPAARAAARRPADDPPAPSTSTCSPAARPPRQVSAIAAATAERPERGDEHRIGALGERTTSCSATAAMSRMLPSPAPCRPRWRTRRVFSRRIRPAPCSTIPTPCTPGHVRHRRQPKYEVPEAQSRSSGVIGAAVTATSSSPARRRASVSRARRLAGRVACGRGSARLRLRVASWPAHTFRRCVGRSVGAPSGPPGIGRDGAAFRSTGR